MGFSKDLKGTGGRNDGPRAVENAGEIPLLVTTDGFDRKNNSITGVNTVTGEEMTISMATMDEFADFFANRERYTSPEDRKRAAERTLAKQPNVGKWYGEALQRDPDDVGVVIQMQSVKRLNDRDGNAQRYIARWGNMLTTTPALESSARAQVQVGIGNNANSKYPSRETKAFFMNKTSAATPSALEGMLTGRLENAGGQPLNGVVQPQILISARMDNDIEVGTASPRFIKETGEFSSDIEEFIGQPLHRFNAQAMAALAGVVGVPIEKLNIITIADDELATRSNRPHFRESERDVVMDEIRQIHDKAQKGECEVAITPGTRSFTMQHLRDSLIKGEDDPRQSFHKRGFIEADVSYQVSERDDDTNRVYMKNMFPVGFIHSLDSENFARTNLKDLASKAMGFADDRKMNLHAVVEKSADNEATQDAEAAQSSDNENDDVYQSYGSSMDPR